MYADNLIFKDILDLDNEDPTENNEKKLIVDNPRFGYIESC
jgi:hypothetical protein